MIGYLPGTNYKPGLNPYSCYTRPLLFDNDQCSSYLIDGSVNLADTFNGDPSIAKYINMALSEYSKKSTKNILFLDPSEVLCSSESCMNIMNGKNIYLGGDHIAKFFSIHFLKEYSSTIKQHLISAH